jgi:hypothetical protein
MPLSDYSPAELEPRHLTKEEIEVPHEVIADIFNCWHLPQLRDELWDWFKVTVAGNFHTEPPKSRSNFTQLFEKLQRLVEAAHILHVRNNHSK